MLTMGFVRDVEEGGLQDTFLGQEPAQLGQELRQEAAVGI